MTLSIRADFAPTNNHYEGSNSEAMQRCVELLCQLVLNKSSLLVTLAELMLTHRTHGDPTLELLDSITAYDVVPGSIESRFVDSLRQLHDRCNADPVRWPQELACLAELSFVQLLRKKYEYSVANVYSESVPTIRICGRTISTHPMSVDGIAWLELLNCGEFLEVKKQIDGIPDSTEKLRALNRFQGELRASGDSSSCIAIATFAPASIERARSLFESYLGAPFEGSIIAANNVFEWVSSPL